MECGSVGVLRQVELHPAGAGLEKPGRARLPKERAIDQGPGA
jgi:hypothetical protein